MRVAITTTITTFVEVDPENTTDIAVARREIFNKYIAALDQDAEQSQHIEAVKQLQASAVVYDQVVGTEVSNTFGEASE